MVAGLERSFPDNMRDTVAGGMPSLSACMIHCQHTCQQVRSQVMMS